MSFNKIQHAVSDLMANGDSSVADYLALFKQLPGHDKEAPHYFRKIRAAFLSNFTLFGLPEVFKVQALAHNIWADTYLGEYNQYIQEVLNLESEFYKFKPDLVYFLIDEVDTDKNQINELVSSLTSKGFRAKLIWGNIIKEKFKDYWYTKYKELGDIRLAPQAFPNFVNQELIAEAIASSGATKKCLVVDLDDTLWKGIVGENNYSEITPELGLQKYILELYKKGIILAINSRNNYDDSISVIDNHMDMVLRKNNFSAIKINWADKAQNMLELAKELNIGLDSFVFIDDDSFQRENIKNRFPEIAVLSPENLESYHGFISSALTEEDEKRGQMYMEEDKRKELQFSLPSLEDFLKQLDLKIEVMPISLANLARVSQLTQKTNQFNLTTRRYSETEINNLKDKGWLILAIKVNDRFGDYGLVGVLMVEPLADAWRVDNFLLSCRILGRGIEKAFLYYLSTQAQKNGVKGLVGEFKPTSKNKPCETFYLDNGFKLTESSEGGFLYRYNLDEGVFKLPNYIKINTL